MINRSTNLFMKSISIYIQQLIILWWCYSYILIDELYFLYSVQCRFCNVAKIEENWLIGCLDSNNLWGPAHLLRTRLFFSEHYLHHSGNLYMAFRHFNIFEFFFAIFDINEFWQFIRFLIFLWRKHKSYKIVFEKSKWLL